jgi:DNA-binding NtrC family response regulator
MFIQTKTQNKPLGREKECETEQEEIDLFIIDDKKYGNKLKRLIEEKIQENVNVQIFLTGESGVQAMKNNDKKPKIVLLDYSRNKMNGEKNHTVDHILETSPGTDVIMLSDKANKQRALKALGYGAHDYVEKDQFAFDHILDSVKTALHPPKE